SRKEQVKTPAPAADLTIRAALYIRLSVEDNRSGSISIETQKLTLVDILIDKAYVFPDKRIEVVYKVKDFFDTTI
ncbi:MAG: hypothetical protein PHE47_08460, partial [Oscillospiraceae bacterium]|nr:hypothetical protein [Oscillospiraceae bacterium]